jgi:hypothetical protein
MRHLMTPGFILIASVAGCFLVGCGVDDSSDAESTEDQIQAQNVGQEGETCGDGVFGTPKINCASGLACVYPKSTAPNGPDGGSSAVAGTCEEAARCTEEAMVCPDGSTVARTGPNCAFAPCPGAAVVDQSKLGSSCADASHVCPSGQSCYAFPTHGFRCASNPCAAMTCSAGSECQILETFPAQIKCE